MNIVVIVIVLVLLYLIIARPATSAMRLEHVENLDERLVKYLGYAQEMAPTNTGISYRTA